MDVQISKNKIKFQSPISTKLSFVRQEIPFWGTWNFGSIRLSDRDLEIGLCRSVPNYGEEFTLVSPEPWATTSKDEKNCRSAWWAGDLILNDLPLFSLKDLKRSEHKSIRIPSTRFK